MFNLFHHDGILVRKNEQVGRTRATIVLCFSSQLREHPLGLHLPSSHSFSKSVFEFKSYPLNIFLEVLWFLNIKVSPKWVLPKDILCHGHQHCFLPLPPQTVSSSFLSNSSLLVSAYWKQLKKSLHIPL